MISIFKNKIVLIIIEVITVVAIFSCNNNNISELNIPKIDYGYFPVDTGRWITYNILRIDIDVDINKYDTSRYQIKEYFESYFLDATENNAVRIERYKKDTVNMPWVINNVWSATLLKNSAQKVEGNIRYVKLIFPVKLNLSWNGNIYNSNSENNEEVFTITSLDSSQIINEFIFDSVLTVTQIDKQSLIDKVYKVEKYAKNVGLIYKKEINVYSDTIDVNTDIMDRITLGTIYEQTISDYGYAE